MHACMHACFRSPADPINKESLHFLEKPQISKYGIDRYCAHEES